MILLLSTSDTDLLSADAAGGYVYANPTRLIAGELDSLISQADIIVLRILGGLRAWQDGADTLLASNKPVIFVSGERAVDATLTEASTVAAGVVTTAHAYLAEGGVENLRNLHNFLSDTLLLTGLGFEAPQIMPFWEATELGEGEGPIVGIIYYRSQHVAGNTAYVEALADAIIQNGGRARLIYAASLRQAPEDLLEYLGQCDALITTVLAAGSNADSEWDNAALAALDIPIIQGLALTNSREEWLANDDGTSPMDTASQIAVPEFDGRIIGLPFSFKEEINGLSRYVPDEERCQRLARLAINHARLRHTPNGQKRIVLMLSAYPTKHARIGNAVGLDTPNSVLALLDAMREAGYQVGPHPETGDELMEAIINAGGYDPEWLTEEVMATNPIKLSAAEYRQYFATLPAQMQEEMTEHWGVAPGDHYVNPATGDIYIAGLQFGNVVVMIQPPRGFGENPVGIYHDPDLPANHHYLASYYWVREVFKADAIVHMGKHGNMEWLPGKGAALDENSYPDQCVADIPLIYPFLVNDPGEGTQAKRRAHATLIDHMIPPMARAETYGDITRLEQLLDEHQNIAAMDPAKLPAIRQEIWTLLTAANMDKDLGWKERPAEDVFDDMLMHIDGWLCEIKDVAIRGGLHILGRAVEGEELIQLVAAIMRARQLWGGYTQVVGLREALGMNEDGSETRKATDAYEAKAKEILTTLAESSWDPAKADELAGENDQLKDTLRFISVELIPRLAQVPGEITAVLHALNGGFIPAGPSGSPMRGLINVLPTGRNFYSVDPRALPSRLAWETGTLLADSLIERYQKDHDGAYPESVGLSVWGTSAMRTSGDDIAEIFALLGIQPIWDEVSRRVTHLELIPLEELGRPRIDVTVRISGFFRDAFPHVIDLLDDAVQLAANADEPVEQNYVRKNRGEEEHLLRIFGSKPGTYGAGLLQLMDSGQWRSDADLAEVYTTWGGYAYGRDRDGIPAQEAMQKAYSRIQVAAKNLDSKEHDIADSDDYFQFHGGMIATVRALTGQDPEAYIGDSTRQETVTTRTLFEESRRVFRARVVNPRWINAMKKHGYKGAFEMSATVDYLFGYDATTGVMDDWMYEQLTETYVGDPETKEFFEQSNPWALRDIAERLMEAADRGLWENPSQEHMDLLRETYLSAEGELEGRQGE
ncbi:MAG: cobaltochelatase subunit CobN [Corynebacterium sp.]|nr:cobaltochelatase subunit CobN [Corynebacterium sp.]